ncbi:MAG TPA: hypothetical protein VFS43_24345 [Polyangiaceae bacterium]|nr:hypothetical protein [Polyangiaceae bacterium]
MRAAAAAALLWAGGASAQQHCHEPAPLERRGLGLRAGLGAEYATYRTARYEGEYQGASVVVQWDNPWVRLRAALPAYRLVRNGLEGQGLGDLLLEGRVPLVRPEGGALEIGAVLAATVPTGDAERELGMGHLMAMPGAFVVWAPGRAFVTAQLGYGGAIDVGSGGHRHHGGPRPIVNPMNRSEVEAAASAGYLVHELVRARVGAYGAEPVFDEEGARRAAAFVGVDLLAGPVDVALEGHLPFAGDPFLAKVVLAAGVRF